MLKLLTPKRRALSPDGLSSIYKEDLKSYKRACQDDSNIQRLDSYLRRLTKQAIDALAAGNDNRPVSFGPLAELTACVLKMNQELAKFVRESEEAAWNDKDFSSLANSYLKESNKTLEFCNAVEKEATRAKICQTIIHYASREFEKEVTRKNSGGRALEELKKLKAAGEPFKDLLTLLESLFDRQVAFLGEVHKHKHKIDREVQDDVKSWRRLSNVMFATAFISMLTLSMVPEATTSAAVRRAVAGVSLDMEAVEGSSGSWIGDLWRKYEEAVKGKKSAAKWKEIGDASTATFKVEIVDEIIERLERKQVATAAADEVAEVRRWMAAVEEEFDELAKRVEESGQVAAKCTLEIVSARSVIMKHVLKFSPTS